MSSYDKRYDKNAPWKSHRSESSSKDPPEGYRKQNSDSSTRRYDSYKDRKYYGNRSWNHTPYAKRHSYDQSRYKYERKPETSNEKNPHEGEISKDPPTESESRNFTSKSTWSSSSSPVPPKPKRAPWIMDPKPLVTNPASSDLSEQTKFSLIFHHINAVCSQNDQSQLDRPMSFIDRIIADEAMRMLSAATSSEVTSLNEPAETAEVVPSNAPSSEETGSSKQEAEKVVIGSKIANEVATVCAADSALLQKSAEQVTKKLINQLSTMNKYDLKHMIDNPAGKYETALNRHAQSKLRAEVRKQLKSFGLGKLGSSYVTGDGTVESDEAIDADKIPSALLEQIGQALDLNFFVLSQTESTETAEQLPVAVENSPSNASAPESKGEHEHGPSSTDNGSTEYKLKQNAANVSGSPRKIPLKNGNSPKSSHPMSERKNSIIIRKANPTIRNRNDVREPVASTLQRKATKFLPKNNSTVLLTKNFGVRDSKNVASGLTMNPPAIPLVTTPVQSLRYVRQIGHATSKDTNINVKMNALNNGDPKPEDANSGAKNVSLLRVSTVDELNRRLGVHPSMNSFENQKVPEFDPTNVVSETAGLSHENISNARKQSAKRGPKHDSITISTDETCSTDGANCIESLSDGAEGTVENRVNSSLTSGSSTKKRHSNAHQSRSPTFSTVQHPEQLNCSNVQLHKENSMFNSNNRFAPFSPPMNVTEPVNADNHMNVLEKNKRAKNVLLEDMNNQDGKGKRIIVNHAVKIKNVARTQNAEPSVSEDKSMAPVTQTLQPVPGSPVQLPFQKGNRPKKRKFPKKNDCLPSTISSSVSSNDSMASTSTEVQSMEQRFEAGASNNGQINNSFPTAKFGKKRKKDKVSRFVPARNIENSNNVADVPPTSTSEQIPSLQPVEETPNEDHILNNAYDQYLNKSLIERAPETVVQRSHITIANVCSMSGSDGVSTPATAITVNATSTNESTSRNSPDLQLPQEITLVKPKDEATTTSQHPEQSVQNLAPSDDCSDGNLPDRNLSTESIAESKEGIERIVSPHPTTDKSTDEYILGGDSGDRCVLDEILSNGSPNHPAQQAQHVANRSATPLPTNHTARLQSLCGITEDMQSIEAQTMELYNRKMQIDALFMQLHAERMGIDQQLERLHNIRSEQINVMRLNLLALASSTGSNESTIQAPSPVRSDSGTVLNGIHVNQTVQSGQSSTQTGTRQHERTIRRITPIGGNSVLRKIFQRRRAPSERSSEESAPMVDLT